MSVPQVNAGVHQRVQPGRCSSDGGLDNVIAETEGHSWLELQDSVKDPDRSEGETKNGASARFAESLVGKIESTQTTKQRGGEQHQQGHRNDPIDTRDEDAVAKERHDDRISEG